MRRISGELAVIIAAVAALFLVAFAAVIFLPEPAQQRQSITRRGSDGANKLRQWFEAEGFTVERIIADPINPAAYDVLFVLSPQGSHSPQEADAIYEWVRDGGKLIVAGDTTRVNPLLEPFGVELSTRRTDEFSLSLAAPTLTSPPVEQIPVRFANVITTERRDTVVHIASGTDPVLLSFTEGEGEVFVTGAVYPFTNSGLSYPSSGQLIANIMAGAVPGETRIGFDEAQLPIGGENAPPSLLAWMMRSDAGRGVLLFGGIMLVYLLSRGRRFGAPVPLVEDRLRREPVEYIVAIANLFRRSGRRVETMQHYKSRLRRHLSERYTIDPYLDDERFARQAATRDERVDERELIALLQQLSKPNPAEADLLSAAGEVDTWLTHYRS